MEGKIRALAGCSTCVSSDPAVIVSSAGPVSVSGLRGSGCAAILKVQVKVPLLLERIALLR